MSWVAVDYDKTECLYTYKPERHEDKDNRIWQLGGGEVIFLPKGSIKKLIGRDLTWEDEPVELIEMIMNRAQRTYLTPEEVQEFINLGVDFGETADVWLLSTGSEVMMRYTRDEGEYLSKFPECYTSLLPAPTLQEVLEVLPKDIELDGEEWTLAFALQPEYNNLWTVFYVILGGEKYHTESDQRHPNPLLAAIELLRWVCKNHPEKLTKTE